MFIVLPTKKVDRTTAQMALASSGSRGLTGWLFPPRRSASRPWISAHDGCEWVSKAYKPVTKGAHHKSVVVHP